MGMGFVEKTVQGEWHTCSRGARERECGRTKAEPTHSARKLLVPIKGPCLVHALDMDCMLLQVNELHGNKEKKVSEAQYSV